MNPAVDALKTQRLLWSDAVQKNTTIITPEEIGQDYLLHIAVKKYTEFIPYHSRNAEDHEDNTIPRVYVSTDLIGCLFGFPFTNQLLSGEQSDDSEGATGIYIHKIPFKVALKPDKTLLKSIDDSRERWLVTYDQESRKYPAEVVGKIIFNRAIVEPFQKKATKKYFELYIENMTKFPISLSPKRTIGPGYWKLMFDYGEDLDPDSFSLEPLSTAEWNKSKKDKAALLSSKTNIGAILNKWKK